jgi:signal peptidase I
MGMKLENSPMKTKKGSLIFWGVAALLLLFCLPFYSFTIAAVDGVSMEPSFHDGDKVIVDKLPYIKGDIHRGDIVAIYISPKENLIKRIVGIPGDTVELRDGVLYVNNSKVEESYIRKYSTDEQQVLNFSPFLVPKDFYFILGDNRLNSIDSRSVTIGPVEKSDIKGKVIYNLQ